MSYEKGGEILHAVGHPIPLDNKGNKLLSALSMPAAKLQTVWHVLPENSYELNGSLGRFTVNGQEILNRLDKALKEIITERVKQTDAMDRILLHIDRRIELAVKQATVRIEAELVDAVRVQVQARVSELVKAMPIKIKIG